MFIAEGVSIVFHEELKSFGVAFSSQKALVKNTPPLQDLYCYGFNNKADYRYPHKRAGQLLFIPFSAMAEKSLNPVAAVESSILKPTQSQNASHFGKSNSLMTASNSDYLPAYVLAHRDIGLAFLSYDKVCAFMFKYDDLFDDDDNIPDFPEDQVVFLSMTSMLSHGKAEFDVYRKEELSVFHQILDVTNYAPSTNLPVTNCTAETAITCIDKNNDSGRTPHAACNAGPFKSEGLTTVATEESERVDVRLESTERISSDAIEMSSAGGNHPRVPGPSDILKDTGYDVYSTGRENAAPRARSQAGGRVGGVELSTVESAAEFYRRNWGVLKKTGWKCIYLKSSVLLYVGKEIEVYMTPMMRSNINTNLNKLNAVENVEFFYSKVALHSHVMENPCLLVDGRDELWASLSSAGWVEVHADDGRTKSNYCPSYYTLSFAKKYLKNDGLNELMPGLHKFTSFTSLVVYIHRFPFLLQSEETFISTLKRLKWVVNEKKKVRWTADDSNRLHATLNLNACGLSAQTVVWISLELLKQLLWMDPATLFQHTSCAHAILDSIRLDTNFALSPDPGPFSPFVAGLTRAERDALLIELVRLFQNQGSNKYTQKSAEVDDASISRHLQKLHWKHEPASFLKSALKCEPAWIAPWLSTTIGDGDEPQLGHDYFWTLTALGKFVDACGMEAILRKPKPSKIINKSESVNDQASLLNFKLRSLANMQQRSAEDDSLMTELLELSGWKIQHRDNGESLYIPGWSVASKAGYDWNLRDCRVGYDFFESRDDAIDHLASHGNVPVEAVVSSDHETESASSPGNIDSQMKAASQFDSSCDVIHHLGQDYDSSSHEGVIIQNLRGGRWFPTVMNNLRCLGWFTSYDKVAKISVICAPWALENAPAAFPTANKKTVNTSILNVNSDYFLDSDEGKNEMYKYLLEVGFARICDKQLKDGRLRSLASSIDAADKLGKSSDSPNLKKARLSSSSTKKHSVNHLGVEYDLNTYQGKVVEILAQQKPYFGVIYDNLKKLGWTSHYEKTLKTTLICAPWAQDVPEAFEENKKCRLQNFILLKENVDYFVDSECGKKALIDYLQRFGFNRSFPIDMDSNKKRKHVVSQEVDTDSVPLKFKAISPQNPCYRAADPSKAIIRHISDVQSPEISSIPVIASCEDLDYDDLQAIMSLQSPIADDRVVSDNEEQCELFHLLLRGERDIGKILSYLRPLGWTWDYPNKRLTALGYSVIYLRPGCSMADEAKLIRHEDIFYSADELVEYLLNQFGIKTDIVDELAPRRITRYGKSSDTFHRDPVAGSPLVVLSKASNVIDRNEENNENLDKGETLSILDRIAIAKNNLHLMTIGQVTRGTESCLAPIERSGSLKIIMDEIIDALENARGAAIYVCGSPGVGKTLTVLTALKELACRYDQQVNLNRSIRANHSPSNSSSYARRSTELLGFNVVILNGADLTIALTAFVLIAEEMNLFNDTAHRSDSMHLIFEHFRRGGAAVDFSAIGDSCSSNKKNCTPMTVLVIDELDLVHKDVLAHLMRCSCMAPSSLVLLGIGNNITLLRQSAAVQVVFEPYSSHELTSILNRSTANIFTRNAVALLVGKVLRNNKGDVRALLNIAEKSIKVAERDAHTERKEILGFDKTTHLVDISHVKQVCDVKDRTVELINGLTMKSKTLMVVSLLLRLDQWHDGMLSLSLLTNAYNSFAIQKGISAESACSVQRMLDELQAYCIMETTNHRSSAKANYRLLVDASVMIQADLGSILLFELKRAMALAEHHKKETL